MPQAVVEVPLLKRRDQEVPHVVTIRKGKRLVLRALPHLHLEERRVLADQDHHAVQADRFGTLLGLRGEKLIALLRHVPVGTVLGDIRIRFDPKVLAKLLVHRSGLLLRCGDRLRAEKTRRIVDASARSSGKAAGDKHHSDGQ